MRIPLKSFYFVRHGETDWNQDEMAIELSQLGIDQASAAGYILSDMQIDVIYTSPLKRASRTADIIAQICEVDVEQLDGLEERRLGKDEELMEDFKNRVVATVSKLLMDSNPYPLIVSHKAVFKVLTKLLAYDFSMDCSHGKVFVFNPSPVKQSWDVSEL